MDVGFAKALAVTLKLDSPRDRNAVYLSVTGGRSYVRPDGGVVSDGGPLRVPSLDGSRLAVYSSGVTTIFTWSGRHYVQTAVHRTSSVAALKWVEVVGWLSVGEVLCLIHENGMHSCHASGGGIPKRVLKEGEMLAPQTWWEWCRGVETVVSFSSSREGTFLKWPHYTREWPRSFEHVGNFRASGRVFIWGANACDHYMIGELVGDSASIQLSPPKEVRKIIRP